MFTPWNSFSACLLARSDRIGRARLDLLNRGDAIPLGVQLFFKKAIPKAPPTFEEGGAFFLFIPRGIKSIFHRGILWGKEKRV